jgi:hypothetical protein
MDIQDLLIGEIRTQCSFALMAYEDLIRSLELIKQADTDELDRFWYSIQAFLLAISNVSKILWPSAPFGSELPAEMSSRREHLRNSLSIEQSSPLIPRKFRNYPEHYDIELEEWIAKSKDEMLVDSNIGPIDLDPATPPSSISYMRNFDPVRFTLILKDEEYQIREIVKAINDLTQKIKTNYS